MKQRYFKEPLPKIGTPERREIKRELINYRKRMLEIFYKPSTSPKLQTVLTEYLFNVEIKLSER